MPAPLVECIPNFSEARRPEVIAAISKAITSISEVRLLDRHSDNDHNRTVITFVGPPDAVEEAAFQGIKTAAELIDLNQHRGSHPRLGATDVVPFVPISEVNISECVAMAQRLGERVGNELNIPVYLYEEAATRPERQNLEEVRRGQYEGLKKEIETNPERKPDFGPARLGPAGATIIGARYPLIAYNVYLNTDDVGIAKSIARTIRHSSGGLRFVKALGMLVEGKAQVSMNLTNYRQTSLPRVVEMIRREAARYGVSIHHSELVGLIPQEALLDAATWYLQLDGFKPDQVLEQRLYSATAKTGLPEELSFLDALAAKSAIPGGGSAAAYVGAMAAGLVAMVARLTLGKKKYQSAETQMKEILNQAERLRAELTKAVAEDSSAFEAVMVAFKMPKDTPEQSAAREKAIEQATQHATRIPLQVAQRAVNVMVLAERVVALGNLNAITDGAAAAALARAALVAAEYNVRINAASLHDQVAFESLGSQMQALEERAAKIEKDVHKSLQERGGISLA